MTAPATVPVLQPASSPADQIYDLTLVALAVCAVILTLVTTLVVVAVIRGRRAPTPRHPTTNNSWLEATWTLLPVALLAGMLVIIIPMVWRMDTPPLTPRAPDLIVRGHQWWWEARYPSGVVTANEIHIPAGTRLLVRLEAADVIHSFWVPQLGRKLDMIPGHPNQLWLEAPHPGRYQGICSEYCGAQHAHMRFTVVAESPDQFARWQRQQLAPAAAPETPEARRGAALFQAKTCASCHRIAGTAAAGRVGPDLTHVGSRRRLAADTMANNLGNMTAWLNDPARFKPESHMPDFGLSADQTRALAAYLEGLQ